MRQEVRIFDSLENCRERCYIRNNNQVTCVSVLRHQILLQTDQIDDDGAEYESSQEHHSLKTSVSCNQMRNVNLLFYSKHSERSQFVRFDFLIEYH